ncbi:hypothetical protein PG991_000698 [Apiospora marii]|uniref:Uncharacterized protein n=1 Tax=Apiospora marii TaxID=335849 RepID=A0ABR1SSQ2_9PEZI
MSSNVIAIVLWAFVLAGCTSSNGLANVYLVSLSYSSNPPGEISDPLLFNLRIAQFLSGQIQGRNDTIRSVRVGYTSLCVASSSGAWTCNGEADNLAMQLGLSGSSDPLNWCCWVIACDVDIIAITFTLIATLLLSVFPRWDKDLEPEGSAWEIKFLPALPTVYAVCVLLFAASCLGFVSAFWQHLGSASSAAMIEVMDYGVIEATVGTLAMTLGWLGVLFTVIPMMGCVLMALAIRILFLVAE